MKQTHTASSEQIRAWLRKNVAADLQMSMIEDPPPASRLELVKVWLEDNVFTPSTPGSIKISEIEFDWHDLKGSFRLSLDNCTIKDRFTLAIDIAGRIQFYPPMFCSPLGAPASYAAVELDTATTSTITKALESAFPRLRGYGLHRDAGLEVWRDSPLEDRIINQEQFQQLSTELKKPGFQITHTCLV